MKMNCPKQPPMHTPDDRKPKTVKRKPKTKTNK